VSSPISGFTAIPNPQMLAFMPIQSYLMMYFAGSGWQYGKRKISAMSNEEFNKLSPEQLISQHSDELKRIMPTLERSLNDVTPLVRILINQYGEFVKEIIAATPEAFRSAFSDTGSQAAIGFEKLFHRISGAFPSLPGASATHEEKFVKQTVIRGLQKDTSGMTLAQHEANQAAKIVASNLARQKHQNLIRTGEVKPVTGAIAPVRTKAPAGQSQRIERQKLITEIARLAVVFKTTPDLKRRKIAAIGMHQTQQNLVNLLNRYRF